MNTNIKENTINPSITYIIATKLPNPILEKFVVNSKYLKFENNNKYPKNLFNYLEIISFYQTSQIFLLNGM